MVGIRKGLESFIDVGAGVPGITDVGGAKSSHRRRRVFVGGGGCPRVIRDLLFILGTDWEDRESCRTVRRQIHLEGID